MIGTSFEHVLHFRCGAHTLELVIEALCSHYTILDQTIEAVTSFVKVVNNNKNLFSSLRSIQQMLHPDLVPLILVLPANTRKWSSGYLVIHRFLLLQMELDLLQKKCADEEFPSIDWENVKKTHDILQQFHVKMQLLQSDKCSVLHLSHVWEELYQKILVSFSVDKSSISNGKEFWKKINRHNLKITGSGVHHLCLSLWPNFSPTSSSKQKALKNLEFIIRKQYDSWVKYRDIVLLPAAFGEKDVEIFSLEARSDLYAHFLGEGHIGKAKEFFKTQVTANLCPDSVGRYWKHVFPSMTALPVIVRILLACSATEASAERFFSMEKAVHSDLRNKMKPELVKKLLFIKCNYETLVTFPN